MEPALTTLCFWPCVPGQAERLHATTGKFNQVLLQGINTKGVLDLVILQVPWGPSVRTMNLLFFL